MALMTRGFQVQAQPGLQYLPASQMVGNLSGILPAASQGAGFVSQLSQIAEEAKAAPIRQALQQIALQRQQEQLANMPMDRQLQQIQLARASQPIERILGTELKRMPRINSPEDTPAQDENGNYTFEEGDTNYDLAPLQRIQVTDPVTGAVREENRMLQPIATAETLTDRADNQELKRLREESLAGQRESTRQLAVERMNNPSWKRIGYGVNPSTGKQGYLIMNERTREIQEVPSDLVPVPTGTDAMTAALDKLVGGGKSNIAAPVSVPGLGGAPVAAPLAPEDTPAQDDTETAGLIDDLTKQFQIAAPVASSPRSFGSVSDAQAAAQAGLIKKGDKITVGGKAGTWQ